MYQVLLKKRQTLTLAVLVIAFILCIASFLSYLNEKDIRSALTKRLESRQDIIVGLLIEIDRNGADGVVSEIVADCSRRKEYESLLGSISELTKRDLLMLQTLSDACGAFYAERKSLMTSLLSLHVKVYTEDVTLHALLDSDSKFMRTRDLFVEILSIEEKRASLLRDQYQLQNNIITALLSGSTIQSKDVQGFAQDAREIEELLSVYDVNADTLRSQI